MWNFQGEIVEIVYLESRKKTPIHCSRKHPSEGIHDKDKEKMRERVSLAKPPGATKEAMQVAIDQDLEASRGNTCRNPLPPFRAKSRTPQNIIPINMIKSLFQIKFA